MSTTIEANAQLTLVEVAKRVHNGQMADIAEILTRNRPCLQHAVWAEANEMFSNVTTQRYSLPAGTFRTFNAGVSTEMSQTTQIRDTIGLLEAYAEHDYELVNSMPSPEKFRTDESAAFIEGLGQTLSSQLWYGNGLEDPEKWTGFAPRLASLITSGNVQGCSGTGSDVSSLYLVQWGLGTVHMIYPRGSAAGLQHDPIGKVTKVDSNGKMWEVYRDRFKAYCGLVVRDPLAIGRVANIETSGSSNIFDEDILIAVKNRMRNQGAGAIGYCSTSIYTQIQIAIKDKSNVFHPVSNPFGPGEVPSLLGIPIYVDDQIVDTESAIS